MKFNHRVQKAHWNETTGQWSVVIQQTATGEVCSDDNETLKIQLHLTDTGDGP